MSSTLDYTGIDAFDCFINPQQDIFSTDEFATFEVRSIVTPLAPEAFAIAFYCSLLLHLPYYRDALRPLINRPWRYGVVRTLLDDRTTIVKRIESEADIDADGPPTAVGYQNSYSTDDVVDFIKDQRRAVEPIDDDFHPSVLQSKSATLRDRSGTRIVGGLQADDNVTYNWKFPKITKP